MWILTGKPDLRYDYYWHAPNRWFLPFALVAGRHMHAISDGERRRVQLCMGLMMPWDLLLLDEVARFFFAAMVCSS